MHAQFIVLSVNHFLNIIFFACSFVGLEMLVEPNRKAISLSTNYYLGMDNVYRCSSTTFVARISDLMHSTIASCNVSFANPMFAGLLI